MSALMEWLRAQKDRRGVLAQLRCGLVPARIHRTWPLLARFEGIDGHKGEVVRTVAALYASHPLETSTGSMGTLCLRLCSRDKQPGEDEKPGPMSMRMQYLLASETSEVCRRVPRLVLWAKTQGIPVNYEGLYKDLLDWQWPERRERIQSRWAQEFWASAGRLHEDGTMPSSDNHQGDDDDDGMPPALDGDDEGVSS